MLYEQTESLFYNQTHFVRLRLYLWFLAIWLYVSKKINQIPLILIVGALILSDMWVVNKGIWTTIISSQRKVTLPYSPSIADQQILNDKDPNLEFTTRLLVHLTMLRHPIFINPLGAIMVPN